jgi:cationic amino acid transporter 1
LGIQVSVGTLLAFTTVAVSVLIIRYVPPDEVPIPASLLTSVDPLLRHSGDGIEEDVTISPVGLASYSYNNDLNDKSDVLLEHPLIIKEETKGNYFLNHLSVLWSVFWINFKMLISSSICDSACR